MNRHLSRVIIMQTLYEWDFRPNTDVTEIKQRNIGSDIQKRGGFLVRHIIQAIRQEIAQAVGDSIYSYRPDVHVLQKLDLLFYRLAIGGNTGDLKPGPFFVTELAGHEEFEHDIADIKLKRQPLLKLYAYRAPQVLFVKIRD